MKRTYNVRYEKHDDFYGCIQTSGDDLTAEHAEIRAKEFLDAEGILYLRIDEVYEVDPGKNRIE